MTSRTTAPMKAQDLGRKEHGRSGSSAIPTTTASWVGQLDCYIWGRRTCELFHRAHSQNILTYFAAPTPPQSPNVCLSRGFRRSFKPGNFWFNANARVSDFLAHSGCLTFSRERPAPVLSPQEGLVRFSCHSLSSLPALAME